MKLPLSFGICAIALTSFATPQTAAAALTAFEVPDAALLQSDDGATFQLARGGDDDRGGDDHGGRGGDDDRGGRGGDDDRGDHDRDDDHGGHHDGDDDGPDHKSGSGRDKSRVPGGSGCDDSGDVAEHAECQV
jgi:hypothetical protein